jgi:hypothetical protein
MWVAVILVCANTLATSCEMRANTNELFFSKASCEANAFNYGRMLRIRRSVCFKVGRMIQVQSSISSPMVTAL